MPPDSQAPAASFTDAAVRWLNGPDPDDITDQPGTVTDNHGIDELWPGSSSDGAIDNVTELVQAAIAAGVIPLPPGITDACLTRTVDNRWIPTGVLIIASTTTDVYRCTSTFFANDLTDEKTGEAGAIAALSNTAAHLHRLASDLHPVTTHNAAAHTAA